MSKGSICERLESACSQIRHNLSIESVDSWKRIEEDCVALLDSAIKEGADEEANTAWFVSEVARTRHSYLACVESIKSGNYYEAWCELERIEISLTSLWRNQWLPPGQYGIQQLRKRVLSWQEIYPYRVFLSPEFLVKREKCSICDELVGPWSKCEHQAGKVYRGRECVRIVEDAEFMGISLVHDPVQKYSVAFLSNENGKSRDHYDYSAVKFVADRITSPLDEWSVQRAYAYHPHELFKNYSLSEGCPCGSGRLYEACCWKMEGVLRPHLEVQFQHPPPEGLPTTVFPPTPAP